MRRKSIVLCLSAMALMLTACGKSDHDVIVEACVAEDASKAYCECAVTAMENNVSPDIPKKIAGQIRKSGKSKSEAEDSLTGPEKIELLKVFPLTFQCVGAE